MILKYSIFTGGESHVAMSEDTDERMDVSLITGAVRQIGLSSTGTSTTYATTSGALVTRDTNMQIANPAGKHYNILYLYNICIISVNSFLSEF